MSTANGDVDAAVAGLRARWGAAAPRVMGALALASAPAVASDQDAEPQDEPDARVPPRRRPRHPHRLRRARCDPRTRRPPEVGQRRDPRRRLQRPDDPLAPRRRGGPGAGLGGGLAGPLAQLRPGRGGRPRRSPRVARRHHPGQPGRGPLDRGLAPGRPLGRPAGARPARRPTREDRQAGQGRRPPRIDSPRSPVGRRSCS